MSLGFQLFNHLQVLRLDQGNEIISCHYSASTQQPWLPWLHQALESNSAIQAGNTQHRYITLSMVLCVFTPIFYYVHV